MEETTICHQSDKNITNMSWKQELMVLFAVHRFLGKASSVPPRKVLTSTLPYPTTYYLPTENATPTFQSKIEEL
eukprot:scaffold2679_cov85-Cyclotella_meneghiniana.AAC.3